MSYESNILRRATERLESERRERSDRIERLRYDAYDREPRLALLDRQLQATMAQLGAAALRRGESAAAAVQAVREGDRDELGLPTHRIERLPEGRHFGCGQAYRPRRSLADNSAAF